MRENADMASKFLRELPICPMDYHSVEAQSFLRREDLHLIVWDEPDPQDFSQLCSQMLTLPREMGDNYRN